jgi:hypothetical protein
LPLPFIAPEYASQQRTWQWTLRLRGDKSHKSHLRFIGKFDLSFCSFSTSSPTAPNKDSICRLGSGPTDATIRLIYGLEEASIYRSAEFPLFPPQLLNKDPARRLGSGPTGSAEIKGHKFFKNINWRKLEARQVVPPFRPAVVDQRCTANFDEMYTQLPVLDSPGTTPKGRHNDFFVG